jgi:deoxyribodipyrimidine photolyase
MCDLHSTRLYANIEYECDELRRDTQFCELAKAKGVCATFVHNKCIIEPGVVVGKSGKTYAVSHIISKIPEITCLRCRFIRLINETGYRS